jgi:HK97 family phage portal protein
MPNRIQRFISEARMRVGLDRPQDVVAAVGLYGTTVAGSNVTHDTSIRISTVYACVYKIASTLASLSLNLYSTDGRNRDIVYEHPGVEVTTFRPNPHETPFYFWETIIANAVLKGVGYAVITRGAGGVPVALQCVDTDLVQRRIINNERIVYRLQDDRIIQQEDMLEICNLHCKSPIQLHRENLGLAQAAQDYGSQYFGNGGQMTGVLSSEQPLKSEQMEMLQKSWNGSMTTAGTKLLPFGFRYNRISIGPEEAQFIETRKFQAEEICRIFSVPPALVQLESQTTYNNVEQQNLMFARHTVLPWAKRIEQELASKLLTISEARSHYFKFNLNDLFRGDMAARSSFYTQMLQNGVMNINEVRATEELNPVAGGDTHTVQVNQIALDRLGAYSDKIANDDNGQSPT